MLVALGRPTTKKVMQQVTGAVGVVSCVSPLTAVVVVVVMSRHRQQW